ncbi:MAG TPA: hypothetical protein PK629_03900 [Oscillospiraceae bacterium]|nr:hypothetical protein [Oscillospiraceae bacterium]HPK35882.1 hypothetical protein [Oscillospiraceae bacterium]HPR76359.1 hypothetical protein [Oscillospiraceae bacterium]
MKKFFAILTCLALLSAILPLTLSAAGVLIDASNFPDPVFRQYVQQFDLNKDGTLSEKECAAVTTISLNEITDGTVMSLEGIKNFMQLERIWCYGNNLTEFDLSGLTQLLYVNCSDNNLESLNLSGCIALTGLYCEYNQLSEINVSGCVSLSEIECSNNRLDQLNLSEAGELQRLSAFQNNISALDLSANSKLQSFSLSSQIVTAQKTEQGGKWTVDLGTLVGKDNLSKIISCSSGTLDTATGILSFDSEPSEFTYTFLTGAAPDLSVKVSLYKGGAPVITANNLTIIQRDTAFDLKSEPGLNLRAIDPEDGDLTDQIQAHVKVISSYTAESGVNAVYDTIQAVDTRTLGRYTITYTVTDGDGNTASLNVYVYVQNNSITSPALTSSEISVVNSDLRDISDTQTSLISDVSALSQTTSMVDVSSPTMGAQNSGVTVVLVLMIVSAAAVFLIVKRRAKAG